MEKQAIHFKNPAFKNDDLPLCIDNFWKNPKTYTVTTDINKVTCKKCLKRLAEN